MEIVVRATVIYLFLWVLIRAMGKRELSEMSAFELILVVIFGDIVQQGVTQEDMSVTGAVLAVGTFALWVPLFSWVTFRFRSTRPALDGRPVVVIHDGKLLLEAMQTQRLRPEDLLDAARSNGIADLSEVRYAVLEPAGRISFVTTAGEQPRDDDRRVE